jgi:lactate 2-monooxygenase
MDLATQLMLEAFGGGPNEWPYTPEDWESRARESIPAPNFDYIAGGAGSEETLRANREAFYRWRLRPRLLTGPVDRDLSIEVLGLRSPVPFFLAPVGVQSIAHPDGELATARAARATGVPLLLSTAAQYPMEQVAEELGPDHPKWYQLYWVNDRQVTASFVRRAEAAGYGAIVVTVDTLRLAWRDRDLRHGYLPFLKGEGIGQYTSDPVFRAMYPDQVDQPAEAGPLSLMLFTNLGLKWADFEWLRQQTSLPLLVKGVLTAEDAVHAREIGIDGLAVSNHGGRQVDGAVAALDALVEVRGAVGADYPLLFDGGIRRGADVLKALALGADAVLLGRPYIYGLAVGGQAGVERVIKQLWAEVDSSLSLVGAHSVRELDRSWLAEAPQ